MQYQPKRNNTIAYLRMLCCSGLDKEVVIPEFLRAVQAVIPSGSNTFSGIDVQLKSVYHLTEFVTPYLDEVTPAVIASFFTPQRLNHSAHWFNQHPVLVDPKILDGLFYLSDLYNLVYRRYDQHHVLIAPVKQDGRPLGMLGLYRPRQHSAFNSREQNMCVQLLPYLAHACAHESGKEVEYGEAGLPGMLVMDTQGKVHYLTIEAKRLLALACQPLLSLAMRDQETILLAKMAQLCRNLEAIFDEKQAAPPSWCHVNGRGRFTFRASWLEGVNQDIKRMISVTIEHQEPLNLKILRALQNVALTPVQKQVALLVAQQYSNERIGEQLHIKLTTVKEHIGKIFDKLGIYRREELLPTLFAIEKENVVRMH